ncbi:hypothetical protein BD413DRAFT_481922 [Trametes elegans]|nr:hypothetical protein BD413DRAFT_481922 [Trametes elegans]
MGLAGLSALFKFAPVQVTLLSIIIYAAVFASVLSSDEPQRVPRNTQGLDLDRAYDVLSQITIRPRPYISHANDAVREYILSRLQPLAARRDYIDLSNDLVSNVTYVTGGHAIYFEGTNVLLKIEGTDSKDSEDGVLFSCHYDSVSSAPGATDDGMGVATLLELAEYLSVPERRPRRTALIFFNNGEEDQLNGAHAYFQHPWANLTSVFINLEGAASGGRPLVFRTTSYGPARSLRSQGVKHPHASVLTSEAFSAGMIRSATDYEIYTKGVEGEVTGLQGLDFAFYKNRAYYHTPRDSIPGMGYTQSRKALWAMLETVRGAGISLLNDDEPGTDASSPVLFDLFGHTAILLSQKSVYATNIVFLVIGPLSTIGLAIWVVLASKKRSRESIITILAICEEQLESVPPAHDEPRWRFLVKLALGWERFWMALIFTALVHAGLIAGFLNLNPYIVHSHAYVVLTIFLGLSFLGLVLPLQALHYFLPPTFASQKLTTTLSLYSFSWLLLVVSTVAISTHHLGSLYWTTFFNISAWLAVVLELVRAGRRGDPGNERGTYSFLFSSHEEQEMRAEGAVASRRLVRGVRYDAVEQSADDAEAGPNGGHATEGEGEIVETDPTEITPLIHQHRRQTEGGGELLTVDSPEDIKVVGKPADEYGWWIAQLLLLVPPLAILLFQVEVLLLNATMHTLVDGSAPFTVYLIPAVFSTLIVVPIAPFAHKLPQSLNVIIAGILVLLIALSWTVFPFTQQWPFRVYFQQTVELSPPSSGLAINAASSVHAAYPEVVRAETTFTGLQGYVDRYLIRNIPSARHADFSCDPKGLRPDLMTCSWASDLLPSPDGNLSLFSLPQTQTAAQPKWLDVHAARLNGTRALLSVRGANTRGCRLYLDRPVTFVYVHQPGDDSIDPAPLARMRLQPGWTMSPEGVREVRLWSRSWDRTFEVEVGWEVGEGDEGGEGEGLSGRAACEYAEYASALGGPGTGLIPAFEEAKQFLPMWVLPTKLTDGLVEVWTKFAV